MASNNKDVKVTLYWLEKSRAQRIVWLLDACKVEYTIKTYKRQSNKLADPALKDIHPLGKSPVVGIEAPGLQSPLILAESGLITDYLASHFAPQLIPPQWQEGKKGQVGGETEAWLRYQYFLHYAEGSLMGLMVVGVIVDGIRNAPVPFFLKPITRGVAGQVDSLYLNPNYATHWDFLEQQLESSPNGGDYLCGKEISAVDILMSFPMIAARMRGMFDEEKHPKLCAYAERLENDEQYQASIKKAEQVTGEKFEVF